MAHRTLSTACKDAIRNGYRDYRWRKGEDFLRRYHRYRARGVLATMNKARHFDLAPADREQPITPAEVTAIAEEVAAELGPAQRLF